MGEDKNSARVWAILQPNLPRHPANTHASIANRHIGRVLGTRDKDLDDAAVDEVHLVSGGVLSHDDLVVEGDGRLNGVGHLLGKVLVGDRLEDGHLVGDVPSIELLDFPSQYRRDHVEDFRLIVQLSVGVLQMEVVLDLLSHGGGQLLAAHVVVNDSELLLELPRRQAGRLQDGRDGRNEERVKDGANIQAHQGDPMLDAAPVRGRIARRVGEGRRLEANHDHLGQSLEEGPAPLGVGILVVEAGVDPPAVLREVVEAHQHKVEAADPMAEDEGADTEAKELGEAVRDTKVEPLFQI